MKIINTKKSPQAIWPYSQAIMAWDMLYSSGQIPLTAEWKMLNWDIKIQTHQVCKNLWEVLKEANLDFKNVIKTTIFLQNLEDFISVNEIYWEYFSHKPARSTVQVARLPKDALIEIEIIAKI